MTSNITALEAKASNLVKKNRVSTRVFTDNVQNAVLGRLQGFFAEICAYSGESVHDCEE